MSESLTVGIFPAESPQGQDLLQQIATLATSWNTDLEIFSKPSGVEVLWQCRNKDIIIFDASIEDDNYKNYASVTGELMLLDHVLVVSRTYLPMNLFGSRLDGYPNYPSTFTNQQIIDWLERQIWDIQKGVQGGKRPRDIVGLTTLNTSWKQRQKRLNAIGQVFISYRGFDAAAVKDLEARIEHGDFHQGEKKQAFYFPPGVLSLELMTEQRRWQIVAIIRDCLMAADEIWIYETKGDSYKNSYYNSWWTLAELLTISYMHNNEKVYLYHPETGSVHKAPSHYFSALTEKQHARAARWFANCTPDEMGPESVPMFRALQQIPLINRIPFVKDHVWSEEFWHYPVLDCPNCREIGNAKNRYDVDSLLFMRGKNFTRFSPSEMQQCLKTQTIVCGNPDCQKTYSVQEDAPQYYWIPVGRASLIAHMMEGTWTAKSPCLVSMPTYLIGEEKKSTRSDT